MNALNVYIMYYSHTIDDEVQNQSHDIGIQVRFRRYTTNGIINLNKKSTLFPSTKKFANVSAENKNSSS